MFRKESGTGGADGSAHFSGQSPVTFGLAECCRDVPVGCLCRICDLCVTHYQQILICKDLEGEIRSTEERLRRLHRMLEDAQEERRRTYREADQAFSTWTSQREPVPR